MAGSLNKVMLIGNVGADPEIRSLGSGDRVANIRLATSDSWKDRNSGERKEKTEWHRVVIFNEHLVKLAENYIRKGSKIYVEGQIQTRKWSDQSGQEKYSTEIVLQKFGGAITLLSGRDSGDEDGDRSGSDDRTRSGGQSYGGGYAGGQGRGYDDARPREDFSADLDDEIPFATSWALR